ncbi:GNAT family protein [Pseudoglutamicibacter cumminsii]|uniref:GNAT family protein n=1 Tax=Pseudoglutamicibacter cumminsii TaxID=156979 RepID=A0AAP4C920_9MICC|nr:GNAT family protein [Pseudoglutamicibacter cumminsii]MDK6275437.1 GNAT family protein [Pseudoglutamicibacter cumminsii]
MNHAHTTEASAPEPPVQAPGSRPHLRRLRASDADAVRSAFASCPEMVRQGNVTDADSAARYVAALVNDDDCADAAGVDQTDDDAAVTADSTADACDDKNAFAVVDENDRLWGLVCINRDAANKVGWFWYWMHAATRKRGWTSQAAATVANWALRDGGYERLELGYRANNPGSAHVAAAAGFVPEGIERKKFLVKGERIDVHVSGRLLTDPTPQTPELEIVW